MDAADDLTAPPALGDDAFISYAHLDNVGLMEGTPGWVSNLHRALEIRVAQLLGKAPHIWRDPKLAGNDMFAETLLERLARVRILVAVVSPRYLKSEWTIRELEAFWHAAEAEGRLRVGDKASVFKVLKTPVPLERTPPSLRALLGYEFFNVDPTTGRVRELDQVFGADAQRDFWLRLDDLAHDIRDLLETLESGAPPPVVAVSPAGQTSTSAPAPGPPGAPGASSTQPRPASAPSRASVYLALATSDLRDRRDALARDLQQHGYQVLPARDLPLVADDLTAAVQEDLTGCRLSIHLVGRTYGLVPEGGTQSIVELQHEIAAVRASADARFARLIWMPDDLEVADDRQREVIERLRLDPRVSGNADFLQTGFEEFRTTVHTWLTTERPVASPVVVSGSVPQLYLVADQRDDARLAPWSDALFAAGFEVIEPVFDGDEADLREFHQETLAACDGVLVMYGAGNEVWLRRKLGEIRKSPGYGRTRALPVTAVCLMGPRTPEKERFRTHEATVVAQWDGCDLTALQPVLDRVKADAGA